MDQSKEPTGYVRVVREGNIIRTGSRIERITANGDKVLESVGDEQTCSWVRQFRGTIRYSPPQENKKIGRAANIDAKIKGEYVPMPTASTYALGVHALQEACKNAEKKKDIVRIRNLF